VARRSVFSPCVNRRRPFLPTLRDRKAVADAGRFRFLTTAQLLQLNWPRKEQRRHGEARLRELFHAGWLDRQPLYRGLGRPHAVYSLGPLGRQYVAELTGVAAADVAPRPARERSRDMLFLQHHLQTVQTVINLEQAAERLGGSVLHYRDERSLRADRMHDRAANPIVPDAFLVLNVGLKVQCFCVELDRATVDHRAWQRRAADYFAWARTNRFRDELKSPPMLVVVDGPAKVAQRRVIDLKTLVEEEALRLKADASLFWFTPLSLACADAALTQPIWLVGSQSELQPLLPEERVA